MSDYTQIAYKCKICNDYIVGVYHELVSCSCEKGWIDVGTLHNRVGGDIQFIKENWDDMYLEKNASIQEYRKKFLWGNYGINEEGESLIEVWAKKKPKAVKEYYNNPHVYDSLKAILTKKQYEEYKKWMEDRPKVNHMLMKDMDSNHILSILETQTQIGDKIKEAFKAEMKGRGIDVSQI